MIQVKEFLMKIAEITKPKYKYLSFFSCLLLLIIADTTITILHNNDTHAHIIPFDDANHGTNCGGAVRRAGLIELIKKEVKEPLWNL